MIEALDHYLARVVRSRRVRRVEPRVVCESERGALLTGEVATADLDERRRLGLGADCLDLATDPGALVVCPVCRAGSGRECVGGRHPERDALAQARRRGGRC